MEDDEDILSEYTQVFARELARWGVPGDGITWEMRHVGYGTHGYGIFVAVLRLGTWDRAASLRLQLGLPFLEKRLRQCLRGHWLADVSEFSGVWLHASENMLASPRIGELRELLAALTGSPVQDSQPSTAPQDAEDTRP